MKKSIEISILIAGWFAVTTQLFLMLSNSPDTTSETLLRFFSYFTILTNTLVAVYFSSRVLVSGNNPNSFFNRSGILTAITVYITIVGLVYQVALRPIWNPTGLQKVVDELLHSVIPLAVVAYWVRYENHSAFDWRRLGYFIIYPLCYLIFILVQGAISGFYPYPFLDVNQIQWPEALINIGVLFTVFLVLYRLFSWIGLLLKEKMQW